LGDGLCRAVSGWATIILHVVSVPIFSDKYPTILQLTIYYKSVGTMRAEEKF